MTSPVPVGSQLAALDRARAVLEQTNSLDEIQAIRAQADALHGLVKAAKLGKDMADRCAEIRLRAERRAGGILADRKPHPPGPAPTDRSHDATYLPPPKLDDLGISKSQSSRWQQVAAIPEDAFEEYIEAAKADERAEITAAGLTRIRRQAVKDERVAKIAAMPVSGIPDGETFPVILADPPWRYEGATTPNRRAESHYPTMPAADIAALRIPAAADAVLFLWTTSPKLGEAFKVIDGWGFTYKTSGVWVKDKIGLGHYFRQRHELLLIATKGNIPTPDPGDRPSSVFNGIRTRHSAKPSIVHELIETMYPHYRKCELFARASRPGWTAWGNQVGIPYLIQGAS